MLVGVGSATSLHLGMPDRLALWPAPATARRHRCLAACSLQGIEHLSLGTTQNGVILLCGLFFYGGHLCILG